LSAAIRSSGARKRVHASQHMYMLHPLTTLKHRIALCAGITRCAGQCRVEWRSKNYQFSVCVKQITLRDVNALGTYLVHKLQNARHDGGLVHLSRARCIFA
jgi:hypothetical protein